MDKRTGQTLSRGFYENSEIMSRVLEVGRLEHSDLDHHHSKSQSVHHEPRRLGRLPVAVHEGLVVVSSWSDVWRRVLMSKYSEGLKVIRLL